jgi:hypothetical protein
MFGIGAGTRGKYYYYNITIYYRRREGNRR